MASTVYKKFRQFINADYAVEVNVGFCQLVGWNLINPSTSNVYLKLGDVAAAWDPGDPPTMKRTLMIPAQGTVFIPNEDKYQLDFANGMFVWATGGIADNDVTAISSACLVEILYNN